MSKLGTHQAALAERRFGIIENFASRKRLEFRVHEYLGKKALILDIPQYPMVDMVRADGYLEQHAIAAEHGISNNCFDIARAAVKAGSASGLMIGEGTSEFIGWANHGINWDALPDETVVAVDLTASANIDNYVGNFDVLALRAPCVNELAVCVSSLYGGAWHVR
jgi:hypothetical protein